MSRTEYRSTETTRTWTLEEEHPESVTFRVGKGKTSYRINITRRYLAECLADGTLTAL